VPHLARACRDLFVFQRTPSSVDVRGNHPIDPEWFAPVTTPGSQQRWPENFTANQNCGAVDEDLLTALLPGAFRRNQLDYYLCGPPAMVTDVLTVLDGLDVPQPRIHTEQFDLV